jgi:Na+/H+ antiporter NhaA
LAFTDPVLTDLAKIGIFAGSGTAGVIGYLVLRFSGRTSS